MSLVYEVQLPIVNKPGTTKRLLKVSVDGVETVKTLEPSDTINRLDPINNGSAVVINLKDVTDAGNDQWGYTLSFTANSSSPSTTVDQVGIKLLTELAVDAPVPHVEPAPVVEPEPVPPPVAEPEPAPEPEPEHHAE